MTDAVALSGGFQSALPTAPSEPAEFTTQIPDCGAIPLDRVADVHSRTLSDLLPSGWQSLPTFNSGI
ncbi:hypothetical protein [Streptomyces resistomycificus]|uniref:hypothetical protein n=1 Tax=Streptomyces resistomycificus TaxID=67356 RepID=UPI00069D9368|nr:hypothetical protein [Streptomyces resistomycificus]